MFRLTIMDEYTRRILKEFAQMDRKDYLHMIRNFDTDEELETLHDCWDYLANETTVLKDYVEYVELRDLTWEELNKWYDFDFDADIAQELVDAYCWWDD